MNLHLSGLAAVLDCLPSAVEGYEQAGDGQAHHPVTQEKVTTAKISTTKNNTQTQG